MKNLPSGINSNTIDATGRLIKVITNPLRLCALAIILLAVIFAVLAQDISGPDRTIAIASIASLLATILLGVFVVAIKHPEALGLPSKIDLGNEIKTKPIIFKSRKEVANYLKDFMDEEEKVDVFTNKLSWVRDYCKVKKMLIKKAKKGDDINIFIPKENPTAKKLKKKKVNIYEHGLSEPAARFTLINRKVSGLRSIAIYKPVSTKAKASLGTKRKREYTVRVLDDKDDSQVIAAAEDLIEIILKSKSERN